MNANRTQATLLGRLKTPDPVAWGQFVAFYCPMMLGWCRRWGLRDADADDVTQDVLMRLATAMRSFEYDASRSFRGWLKMLAHHAWHDFVQERRKAGLPASQASTSLDQEEARADLQIRLSEQFDLELFAMARDRVRIRVEPRTWTAFELQAMHGLSGAEAAERAGMTVATAFVARSKVQKMIRAEIERLDPDLGEVE